MPGAVYACALKACRGVGFEACRIMFPMVGTTIGDDHSYVDLPNDWREDAGCCAALLEGREAGEPMGGPVKWYSLGPSRW